MDKKRKFKPFDLQRDGRGIGKKEALAPSGLKRFFVTYGNNFTKIVYVNIFMVLGNFPLIFLIATLSGLTKNETLLPMSDLFQNLGFIFSGEADPSPFNMALYSIEGLQNLVRVNTPLTYVFYGISALTMFTFGLVNVGTAYILRNIAMGDPVFAWTDFWYAVRRNWKQALPFGIIDIAINGILIYNIFNMVVGGGGFFGSMLFWCNVVIFVLYFIMRYYIYIQMVTFKLSIVKILKNSMIFALIGMKRNILALLGIVVILVLEVMFLLVTALQPVAVAAPLAILFSTFAYMKVYAAYFKIKEIMIDPYKAEHPELYAESDEEFEVVMRDDVTDRQRLEEIKKQNNID